MIKKVVRVGIGLVLVLSIVSISRTTVLADTASVSSILPIQTVAPGSNFDVDISVTSGTQVRGIQFTVAWDPAKVTCNSVEEGTFFKAFVQQNSLMSEGILPSAPAANNTTGTFPSSGFVSMSLINGYNFNTGVAPGPTGTGNVYILHMTAKSGASGTGTFTLSNVILYDNNSPPNNLNPTITSGQINISNATTTPPTISDFNPKTGGTGTTVTITGTNFTNLTTVKFGGTAASSFTTTSSTQITAVVGTGTTGVVTVANTGGSIDSTSSFNFVTVPTITAFSPVTTGQGKTVTITGTNLSGATTVTFGGTSATIASNTSTQILATIGAGTSGVVSVTTQGGTATKTGFTFAPTPTISDFNPKTGGVGTTIVITGSNFGDVGNTVNIGGVVAGVTTSTATQITATVGAGATSGNVSVTTAGGTATLTGFTFAVQPPTIVSFTPTSGSAGISVIITGTNLTGATAVSFGGTAVQSFAVNSSTKITAVVGTGTTGNLSITTPGGTVTKDGFTFTTITTSTTSTTTSTTSSTTTTATPTTASSTTNTNSTTATSTATTPTTSRPVITNNRPVITSPVQVAKVSTLSGSGPVTSLDLSDSMDTGGMLQTDFLQGNIRYSGNNQIVSLSIKNGTRVVNSDGSPVTNITIQAGANVPAAPAGENIVSAVELGPTGATFSSPIAVVYQYDAAQVPHNINASGLALEYFDIQANKWVNADYSVDIQNHQITANLSHFSLYAVMFSKSTGFMGVGWSLAGLIIIFELLLGGLVVYYFIYRRRPLAPARAKAQVTQSVIETASVGLAPSQIVNTKETPEITWDDILPRNVKKGEPFKTHLEIIGGKIIIPTGTDSVGIELVNNPDSRILVSLEYDPELHPRGLAKIMVLGSIGSAEYQKSKGE